MFRRVYIAAITALAAKSAFAAEPAPLTLDEVLRSSARQHPEIIEAMSMREAAAGRALSSRGVFDLVFKAENQSTLSGYYDGAESSVGATQELGVLGARVYGGYRMSRGDFPVYRDAEFTDRGGEAKVGMVFSLLRDRETDRNRLGVRNADIDAQLADLDLALASIGIQQRSADAYFRWLAAGRQLAVYRDLLALAEVRQSALEREVEAGARARIFLTENAQNIARRRVLVVEAEQRAAAAANDLSLYLRDAAGAPVIADPVRLPLDRAGPNDAFQTGSSPAAFEDAFARRPDLLRLSAMLERTRNKIRLARNDLLPRLDLSYELSNDFGAEGLGGPTRDGTENIVGLRFSAPLQRRTARGDLAAAEAELSALQQRRRMLEDRAEVELRNIVLDVGMSEQRVALVAQEVAQSEEMEKAERRRFSSGASDFFLVNLREEAAASARVRLHQADLDRATATSALLAATVDLDALRLAD